MTSTKQSWDRPAHEAPEISGVGFVLILLLAVWWITGRRQ